MPFPKKGITYKPVQPMAALLNDADDERTLIGRSFFARSKTLVGSAPHADAWRYVGHVQTGVGI